MAFSATAKARGRGRSTVRMARLIQSEEIASHFDVKIWSASVRSNEESNLMPEHAPTSFLKNTIEFVVEVVTEFNILICVSFDVLL
jgi:hypothetical protein